MTHEQPTHTNMPDWQALLNWSLDHFGPVGTIAIAALVILCFSGALQFRFGKGNK